METSDVLKTIYSSTRLTTINELIPRLIQSSNCICDYCSGRKSCTSFPVVTINANGVDGVYDVACFVLND